MFCRNCGKEIDEKAVFCTECGAKIEKEASSVGEQILETLNKGDSKPAKPAGAKSKKTSGESFGGGQAFNASETGGGQAFNASGKDSALETELDNLWWCGVISIIAAFLLTILGVILGAVGYYKIKDKAVPEYLQARRDEVEKLNKAGLIISAVIIGVPVVLGLILLIASFAGIGIGMFGLSSILAFII